MAEGAPPWGAVMAEGVGFEPTVPFGTTVFKTVTIDHSDTPPTHELYTALPLYGNLCNHFADNSLYRASAAMSYGSRTSSARVVCFPLWHVVPVDKQRTSCYCY